MTRPSTRAVRRAAADLSDQVTPHLSSAKDTLLTEVVPKVRSTGAGVLPTAKSAGVGLAVKAHLMDPPKKRHPWRLAAILGAVGVGAYAAWNAWRLPHASDDWAHADSSAPGTGAAARTDGQPVNGANGAAAGSPTDTSTVAF